ncbi:hypothetical protein AHT36_21930 [Salmonella enterica subsp. enterica]|nr:hypothetical protein [Salmonella enterica subsp. enterica]
MRRVFERNELTVWSNLFSAFLCGIPLAGLLFCWFYIFAKLSAAAQYYGIKFFFIYLAVLLVAVPAYAIIGINLCIHTSWLWAWVGMSSVSFIALRILAFFELRILDRIDVNDKP